MRRDQETLLRLKSNRRVLQALAGVVSVTVVVACVERIHTNAGVWGVFVPWVVVGIVVLVWPLAFLVTGFGATTKQRRAVYVIAFGLTVSSIGMLQIGWGLVMLLDPDYAVGWYLPARSGGSEIDDVADAVGTGRVMIAVGAVQSLLFIGLGVGLASSSDDGSGSKPARHAPDVRVVLRDTAAVVLWLCGGLFWVVALLGGLITVIQYDGVRRRLAGCSPGSEWCATDRWIANEFPWLVVVVSASAMALVVAAVLAGRSSWLSWWDWDRLPGSLVLVTGWLYQTGSVVATASTILYLRWSDTTCTGRERLRTCGVADPQFSFTGEWLPWVTVWVLLTYAVVAYGVVFGLLGACESEVAAHETGRRKSEAGGEETSTFAGRHVVIYLVCLALLLGAGWSAIVVWQRASAPPEAGTSWGEYAAEHMSPTAHPHLQEVRPEFPSGGDSAEYPLLVHVDLSGDEVEMPSAEAIDLIDAACAYEPSPWKRVAGTLVHLTYNTDRDGTRYLRFGCGSGHHQAVVDLLTWVERNPATDAVTEISIKAQDEGVLEVDAYLPDASTASFREALPYLCSIPATRADQVVRSILDNVAVNRLEGIDCTDAEAAVAQWPGRD